jgi:alpha-galactosidase
VRSETAPADTGHNWHQRLAALDTTHPAAQSYLHEVFRRIASTSSRSTSSTPPQWSARHGDASRIDAYRHGVELIRAAMLTGRGRAYQHGRFWVNDPDCLIVRPEVEDREAWAEHVASFGGLRSSSDRIADLDDWGMERTRTLLGTPAPATFVPS